MASFYTTEYLELMLKHTEDALIRIEEHRIKINQHLHQMSNMFTKGDVSFKYIKEEYNNLDDLKEVLEECTHLLSTLKIVLADTLCPSINSIETSIAEMAKNITALEPNILTTFLSRPL